MPRSRPELAHEGGHRRQTQPLISRTHKASRPHASPIDGWRHGSGGARDGPPTAPSQLPREGFVVMSPNHARHVSEDPARPIRPTPDMPATSSSTRRFTHCGQIIIPGHYRRRYRAGGNPAPQAAGNIVLASRENHRPGRSGHKPSDQGFLTSQVVRFGNKQNVLAIADPKGSIRNTFPFVTGTTCRQWRGRGRRGPRCGVS